VAVFTRFEQIHLSSDDALEVVELGSQCRDGISESAECYTTANSLHPWKE